MPPVFPVPLPSLLGPCLLCSLAPFVLRFLFSGHHSACPAPSCLLSCQTARHLLAYSAAGLPSHFLPVQPPFCSPASQTSSLPVCFALLAPPCSCSELFFVQLNASWVERDLTVGVCVWLLGPILHPSLKETLFY